MSNKDSKRKFLNVLMSSIEDVSGDKEKAIKYLASEGIDTRKLVEKGLSKIAELKSSIKQNSHVKSVEQGSTGRKWKNTSVSLLISRKGTNSKNPIDIVKDEARDLVLKAYGLGWSGPPYSPIELARLLGIEVSPNSNLLDARIIPEDKRFLIEYNPFQKESRINFSIAHEIGHTLFPDCRDKIRNREENRGFDEWELEYLCDIAAAEILLPYSSFSEKANSVDLNLNSILQIAKIYQASLESVFLRFCEAVDKPCAMAIAQFQDEEQKKLELVYYKSSRALNLEIPQDYKIPANSKAYDCLNSGWTANGIEHWNIFRNTRFNISAIGLPPLKKNKKQRVGLFIVPEFYSDIPESNIYTVFGDATQPRGDGNKIIVQLLNTTGGVGFGFGKSLSKKWPVTKKNILDWKSNKSEFQLGGTKLVQLEKELYVFQMIAQEGLFEKNGKIPLRYDVLKDCLMELVPIATSLSASIHMPQIGAGQAKGKWSIIEGIIHDVIASKGIKTSVYILPGSQAKAELKSKSNLTLFDDTDLYEK